MLGSLFGAVSATDAVAKAGDVTVRIVVAGLAEMLIPAITGLMAGISLYLAHALLVSAADRRSLRVNEQLIGPTD